MCCLYMLKCVNVNSDLKGLTDNSRYYFYSYNAKSDALYFLYQFTLQLSVMTQHDDNNSQFTANYNMSISCKGQPERLHSSVPSLLCFI